MKTINFANLLKREKSSKFAMEKLTATQNSGVAGRNRKGIKVKGI